MRVALNPRADGSMSPEYTRTVEIISEECGDSPKQVQRYISLTKLIPEFLQKLEDELISFNPAVEIRKAELQKVQRL